MRFCHPWRISRHTHHRFLDLCGQLKELDPTSDEAIELRDQVRRLPGFPTKAHPTLDLIEFEVVD